MLKKISIFIDKYHEELVTSVAGALIAFSAFGLGHTIGRQAVPAKLIVEPMVEVPLIRDTSLESTLVASRNGSRYYLPDCSGVNNIKEENLIGFSTEVEARGAGYTPAKNCAGLKAK